MIAKNSDWNFQNSNNECISPLIYSNNKSQEDVTNEIIETFKTHDVVTVKGGVGSGKSVIALHLVSHYGSGIIVVPTKILERQYVDDYCGNRYHFDMGGQHFPIHFMFGKGNFNCRFSGNSQCTDPDMPCNQKLSHDESRVSAASRCEYWSPIYPEGLADRIEEHLPDHTQNKYQSVQGEKIFFKSPTPCDYYDQFSCYGMPGAIVMNLAKWEAETWIGRKPLTPVEVIDEGDMFLDGLSYRKTITPRTFTSLKAEGLVGTETINTLQNDFVNCLRENRGYEGLLNESITTFLTNFVSEMDEEGGMITNIVTTINLILQYNNMAYAQIEGDSMTIFLSRRDIVFSELKKRSGKILLMSATMQTPSIFTSVFKFDSIPLVEAEPHFPGTMNIMYTQESINIQYQNWANEAVQKRYFKVLDDIIKVAEKPTLVQVHAMKYVPPDYKELLNKGFINNVSWSTVTDRGIDLADDKCRSIVITKFPLPNISDIVFRVLRQTLGDQIFWQYMRDMANRDLIQQCGRAIRHKNDWCQVWSPDEQVMPAIHALWKGTKNISRIYSLKNYKNGEKQDAF